MVFQTKAARWPGAPGAIAASGARCRCGGRSTPDRAAARGRKRCSAPMPPGREQAAVHADAQQSSDGRPIVGRPRRRPEHVEQVLQVLEELARRCLACVDAKPCRWRPSVYAFDQPLDRAAFFDRHPERQIVAVVVAVVFEAAVVGDQPLVLGLSARCTNQRPLPAGQVADDAWVPMSMLAFLGLAHVLVVDPAPAWQAISWPRSTKACVSSGWRCSAIDTPNTVSGRRRDSNSRSRRHAGARAVLVDRTPSTGAVSRRPERR